MLNLTSSPLALALVGLIVMAVAATWAVRRNRAIVFDKARYPGLVELRRLTLWARYGGLLLAVPTFALVAVVVGDYYCGLFLAPAVAGILLVLVVVLGQQMAYGRARTPGVAAVERRRVRDYLPRALTVGVFATLLVLTVVATWTTVEAGQDDLGLWRALVLTESRTVITASGPEVVVVGSVSSPFPGWFYTRMLAIGIPLVLVLAGAGLALTARRPRNGSDPELVRVDDALRRQTAEGLVGAAGLAIALSLFGVSVGAALPLANMAEHGARYTVGALLLGATALGALAVAVWCLVIILVPGGGSEGGR